MENQKGKKSVGTIVLVVLLLIVTVASLVLATYAWARYTTVENGSTTANVAKWDVSFKNGSSIFTQTFNHVVSQRLAPGTYGQFDMEVNSKDTEIDYDYKIMIKNLKNKPTNLHFYATKTGTGNLLSDYADEITFYDNATVSDLVRYPTSSGNGTNLVTPLYGHVDVDATNNVAATNSSTNKMTIYWVWEYQTAGIYHNKSDVEALPADINTVITYTNTTTNASETTSKQQRIIHDLKEMMYNKGIEGTYDSANHKTVYTVSGTTTVELPDNATLAQMQALGTATGKEYTVTKNVVQGTTDGITNTTNPTVTKAEIDQVINNAIDTVDGLAARTMSFDVEYTAIQCDPATGTTEFTEHIPTNP